MEINKKNTKKCSIQNWEWKKYPEIKPKNCGVIAIVRHDPPYIEGWPNNYLPQGYKCLPDKRFIQWARWGYTEELIENNEKTVTYSKRFCFLDEKKIEIYNVIAFLELPPYPQEIFNETK